MYLPQFNQDIPVSLNMMTPNRYGYTKLSELKELFFVFCLFKDYHADRISQSELHSLYIPEKKEEMLIAEIKKDLGWCFDCRYAYLSKDLQLLIHEHKSKNISDKELIELYGKCLYLCVENFICSDGEISYRYVIDIDPVIYSNINFQDYLEKNCTYEFKCISEQLCGDVRVIQRSDYTWGVVDSHGIIVVPFGKYGWIDGFELGLARVRNHGQTAYIQNCDAMITQDSFITDKQEMEIIIEEDRKTHPEKYAKWGIINTQGEVVLPVEYDSIWKFYGKRKISTRVEKNGVTTEVFFCDLNPELPKRYSKYAHRLCSDYGSHFGEFSGSYAQDVMGYSDEAINDAFEGDPDAYWNID